ncbi:hypothetical protein BU24DRAFT_489031 [Aaosphaeria arxii CBS 175.79]|uniref:Uncharacterized protein n=1 Tax=Aaosphaeria arxii CBS 175.79 TaxID=1450172 RepID=A0A6A5Y0K3_9PLEO|nr:uncharacterized protein BU24DRAFT_489031 [Aaosphaeria arxii CBS 175.79]KAF2018982.1 hypothetical protein BU24DRAFT_489031 [Aaosphaeria arxii CBS 175.79]
MSQPAPSDNTKKDDLLLSLQSSLRNAHYTFGASSRQYKDIKAMVEEHIARTALSEAHLEDLTEGFRVMELAIRTKEDSVGACEEDCGRDGRKQADIEFALVWRDLWWEMKKTARQSKGY